jgi:hypothetical protein
MFGKSKINITSQIKGCTREIILRRVFAISGNHRVIVNVFKFLKKKSILVNGHAKGIPFTNLVLTIFSMNNKLAEWLEPSFRKIFSIC